MAIITTSRTDSLDDLRINTNEVSDRVGDTTTLTTTSTDLTNAVNEHDAEIGDTSNLDTDATTVVGAINEHESDIGTVADLDTTATDLTEAINEHEDDLYTSTTGSFDGLTAKHFKGAIEETIDELGQVTDLTTTHTSTAVGAINELHSDIGDASLDTTASNLTDAINELEDDLYTSTTGSFDGLTAKHFKGAVEEIVDELGQVTSLDTTATTAVGAINEIEDDLYTSTTGSFDGLTSTHFKGAIEEIVDELGQVTSLDTTATTAVGAINELEDDLYTSTTGSFDGLTSTHFKGAIEEIVDELGQVTSLDTTATDVVSAINELEDDLYTSTSVSFIGLDSTNFQDAIEELNVEKVDLTSSSDQSLNTDLTLSSGKTLTISGTIDISNGNIIVPAGADGVYAVNTSYLQLGDPEADTAPSGGLILSRGDGGGDEEIDDVRLFWDETANTWKVKGLTDDATPVTVTSELLTRYNAKDLFDNNTETGITVAWDATNQNFDISIDNNGIALGTKTTGNYVATIAGTANEIEVTGSGSETAAVTIGLPTEPVVGGITAGNVKLDVGTNNGNITTTSGDLNIDSATNTVSINATTNINGNVDIDGTLDTTGKATLNSLEVTNDAVIKGDLYVEGTTTTVNSNAVNIGDNIIVLNGDETGTPSQNAGIEIERGTASNVSVEWNETSDRWQFTDTAGTWNMIRPGSDTILTFKDSDGTIVSADTNDTIQFIEGSGMDVNFTDTSEPSIGLTFTNTDRGSSQAIFKRVIAENADGSDIGTITADNNNDILYIREGQVNTTQGIELAVDATNDILTISHADTSSASSLTVNNSGLTVLQDLSVTLDTYGHVTGVSAASTTINVYDGWKLYVNSSNKGIISENEIIDFKEGGGIDLAYSTTNNNTITISHQDTSSVANLSSNNSGKTFIQDIAFTFDTYGHVTAASVATNNVEWYFKDGAGASKTIENFDAIKFTENGVSARWSTGAGTSSDPFLLALTNTDKGSSQAIFKNIAVSGQTSIVADSNNDTLTVAQGDDLVITTNATTDTLTIDHADITRTNTTDTNSNGVAVTGVTTNARGHVTGVNSYDFDNRYVQRTGDTMSGMLHIAASGDELLRLTDNTSSGDAAQNPYITFYQASDRRAYIQYVGSGNYLQIVNDETDEALRIKSGLSGLTWVAEGNEYTVYHSGNQAAATASALGTSKLGSDTEQTTAANSVTSTASRTYAIQHNSSDQMVVNVPWLAYSAGAGLDISGTTFSVESDLRGEAYHIGISTNDCVTTSDSGVLLISGGTTRVTVADATTTVANDLSVSGTFYETSDERVKENVVTIDSALDKVSNLRGVTYNKIGEVETQIGVIAQEVEKVIPEVVKTDEDGMKSVAYANMVGLLIEAIKDLKSEIDDIKSKL